MRVCIGCGAKALGLDMRDPTAAGCGTQGVPLDARGKDGLF